jgi:hypothetical protein
MGMAEVAAEAAGESNSDSKIETLLKVQISTLCTSTRVAPKQSVHLLPDR